MKPGLDTVISPSCERSVARWPGVLALGVALMIASGTALAHGGGGGGGGGGEGAAGGAALVFTPPPGFQSIDPSLVDAQPVTVIGGDTAELTLSKEQLEQMTKAGLNRQIYWSNLEGKAWRATAWVLKKGEDVASYVDRGGQYVQLAIDFWPDPTFEAAGMPLTISRGFADAYRDTLLAGGSQKEAIVAGLANAAAQAGLSHALGQLTGGMTKHLADAAKGTGKFINKFKGMRRTVGRIVNGAFYTVVKGSTQLVNYVAGNETTNAVTQAVLNGKRKGYSNSVAYSPAPYHPMVR